MSIFHYIISILESTEESYNYIQYLVDHGGDLYDTTKQYPYFCNNTL